MPRFPRYSRDSRTACGALSALSDPPTWYARGPALAADQQAVVTVRRSSLHDNRTDGGSLYNVAVWNSSLSVESSSLVNDTFSSGGIEAT